MKTRLLALAFIAFITFSFSSCSSTKSFPYAVPTVEMSDILQLETISYIQLVERGSRMVLCDSMSERSKYIIHDALQRNEQIPLADTIYFWDPNDLKTMEKEIEFLIKNASRFGRSQQISITPKIFSAIQSSGKRYGLITYSEGFNRTNGNYAGQIALSVLIGVATMGTVMYMPNKSYSTINFLIVDIEKDEVSFFYRSNYMGANPLNPKYIDKQIQQVFKNEFKPKNVRNVNEYDF